MLGASTRSRAAKDPGRTGGSASKQAALQLWSRMMHNHRVGHQRAKGDSMGKVTNRRMAKRGGRTAQGMDADPSGSQHLVDEHSKYKRKLIDIN